MPNGQIKKWISPRCFVSSRVEMGEQPVRESGDVVDNQPEGDLRGGVAGQHNDPDASRRNNPKSPLAHPRPLTWYPASTYPAAICLRVSSAGACEFFR